MLSSFVFSGSRWKVQTPLSRLDKHVLYNCMRSASKNSIGDATPIKLWVWTGFVLCLETIYSSSYKTEEILVLYGLSHNKLVLFDTCSEHQLI